MFELDIFEITDRSAREQPYVQVIATRPDSKTGELNVRKRAPREGGLMARPGNSALCTPVRCRAEAEQEVERVRYSSRLRPRMSATNSKMGYRRQAVAIW